MVKHNNVVPNQHFKKQWQKHIKTWFDQPARKKRRRIARQKKAQETFPRPVAGLLRPAVHCPTVKHNYRLRSGRGFTLDELKAAGINRREALGVGIAVDVRRRNKSVEALNANVARLKEFKAKLVVFPRKNNTKPKNGDSSLEETSNATQLTGEVLPIAQTSADNSVYNAAQLKEAREGMTAFEKIRRERVEQKLVGKRMIAKKKKEEEAKAPKGGKKKKK